jgi:hypothetical protein
MNARILLLLLTALTLRAAVVRVDVKSRTQANGFERVAARVYYVVDPALPVNRAVADLDRAPCNAAGQVEFSADVLLLRPAKSNGTLLLDIPNRGGARATATFSDAFLAEQGYTVAEVGWQFDLLDGGDRLRVYVPEAAGVRGQVRSEIVVNRRESRQSVTEANHRPYKILNPDDPGLTLTVRDRTDGPRQKLPRSGWHVENADTIVLESGFEPGLIYELVYTAENPAISGLGMAAVRDFASYIKFSGNYTDVKRALGFGISQSGRFLREYLYFGFNRDERDRKVFDGVWANVAGGGMGSFNVRFAQPGRVSGAHTNTVYPIDRFPFTDLEETDPVTRVKDGLLTHAMTPAQRPKLFYTYSSHEYYGRNAALIHITPDGKRDAPLPADTRIYFFAGGAHGPAGFPPRAGNTLNAPNPNPYTMCFRALLTALNRWVTEGAAPPVSAYPKIASGELVELSAVKFPKLSGIALPRRINHAHREDGSVYPALVPQVDQDGNDLGGVRMPEIAEPLATYTGWNLRAPDTGAPGELASLQGSWIPFPRATIAQRYPTREDYLKKFEAAARKLVATGFLLPADLPKLLERGVAEYDHAQK